MDIKVNYPENDNYINNLAYIKAFFIKIEIESLPISFEEKKDIYNKVLDYLKEN